MSTHPPDGILALTPKQEARRNRVIQAALALGAEGGYDAVQMRDVAATANVALGTIYRYFSSKDHLLAAAMADWTGELRERLGQRPPRGETPTDQLVDVLRRACRSLERQPRLTAALVKALSSPDPGVPQAGQQVGLQIRRMSQDMLDFLEPDVHEGVLAIIGHVWFSALLGWAIGRSPISQVGDELERAVRLLLAPYDTMAAAAAS
jgi:AcrR family transcriptional regulator